MDTWTVHVHIDRVPDGVELLDRLSYMNAKLEPIDHRSCSLELTVRHLSFEDAMAYAEDRVDAASLAIDTRLFAEALRVGRVSELV